MNELMFDEGFESVIEIAMSSLPASSSSSANVMPVYGTEDELDVRKVAAESVQYLGQTIGEDGFPERRCVAARWVQRRSRCAR